MGKIKSKQVKRSVKALLEAGIELEGDFEMNKKILGAEMPSKKLRNKMAGHATRLKKTQAREAEALKK